MARSSSYTYNPETGEWSKSLVDNKTKEDKQPTKSSGDNLTSSTPDKDNGTGSVEKKYNTIELNTLNGTLSFIVTKNTIKLKAGDTVRLEGLGKHLSGDYYVKDLTRQISSSGYSHSATLIRTDFGSSIKVKSTSIEKKVEEKKSTTKKKTKEKKVQSTPKASKAQRTYTVKKGDTLWKIAKQFYGNGNLYTKIYDANTNEIANPDLIYIGQVFVIP